MSETFTAEDGALMSGLTREHGKPPPMTSEDFRALQKIAGLTNKETAERLGVALRTVEAWRAGYRGLSAPMAELITIKLRRKA